MKPPLPTLAIVTMQGKEDDLWYFSIGWAVSAVSAVLERWWLVVGRLSLLSLSPSSLLPPPATRTVQWLKASKLKPSRRLEMIVQHWASINIVSVKPLGITSVSQSHLNSEKKISIISINQLNDLNSCFVKYIPLHHRYIISNPLPYSSTELYIIYQWSRAVQYCLADWHTGIIPLFEKEKLGQFQLCKMHSLWQSNVAEYLGLVFSPLKPCSNHVVMLTWMSENNGIIVKSYKSRVDKRPTNTRYGAAQ